MTRPRNGLGNDAANLLRTRRQAIAHLQPPDETFHCLEVPDALGDHLRKLENAGIVEEVGTVQPEGCGRERILYRTTEAAWQYRKLVYDPVLPGPCNHRGVRCIDADERRYTCLEDSCDQTFGVDVFRERVSRGEARATTIAADGGEVDAD